MTRGLPSGAETWRQGQFAGRRRADGPGRAGRVMIGREPVFAPPTAIKAVVVGVEGAALAGALGRVTGSLAGFSGSEGGQNFAS